MGLPKYLILVVINLTTEIIAHPNHPRIQLNSYPFPFVTREEWGAKPPTACVTKLNTPVPYVVIHHTYIPGICLSRKQCMKSMLSMQKQHQDTNGWFDIGYNFAVGGEGSVYDGRGWESVGAHAAGTNSQSIGIALIGDFVSELPPTAARQTAKQLIAEGVKRGYIKPDYQLIGHRNVSSTECPGEALFREIQTWARFSGSYRSKNETFALTD